MDSKWGGKTETINMQLNVEQVCENLKMFCYHTKDQANYKLLDSPKSRDYTCKKPLAAFPTLWAWSFFYIPKYNVFTILSSYLFKTDRVGRFDFQNNSNWFSSGDFGLLLVEVLFLAWVIFCTLYWSSVFYKKKKQTPQHSQH